MADMTTIKGRIAETIYPNGTGAITAESHQALLLEMVDDINAKKADKEEVTAVAESVSTLSQEVESNYNNFTKSLDALEQKVDNLPQGEEFDAEGNYPSLRVGTADTAIDLAGRGESVPASFGFRASGGKSIRDGRAYIKRIKGNSVVWNNQSENSLSQDSPTQSLPIGSKLVQGHKYLMLAESITNCVLYLYYNIDGSNVRKMFDKTYSFFTSDASISANGLISGQGALWWYVLVQDSTVEYSANNVRLIDLTQMFGAGNEPTTIEEFNARVATLGVDMYAYNEGEVIHCNTESIKSVGDNAWDEQWESGRFSNMGIEESYSGKIRSKNYIPVLANVDYYYTSPISLNFSLYDKKYRCVGSWQGIKGQDWDIEHPIGEEQITFVAGTIRKFPRNVSFIKFSTWGNNITTYNHDIMITLVHSGWKQDTDAGYQPYWQDTLPLPIIRKYFPDGMKSAGSAHDEIRFNKASGKWEYSKGKIKSVDLGTLNWNKDWYNEELKWRIYVGVKDKAIGHNNLICGDYFTSNLYDSTMESGSILGHRISQYIYLKNDSFSSQGVDALIASLQGVMLYYESNDWEWVELDAEDQNFRDYYKVADFGTEMSQSSVPSAAFSADIIYQFNAVDMIREHEIEITELQNVIATMQAQLASLTNKE